MLRLVCDYIDVTQFDSYMFSFVLRCLFKYFSHFSSIDITPLILNRWRIVCAAYRAVWSGFGGVIVQQVALWCVCARACVRRH